MKKNVCITIKSTQTVDQDKDSTELFTFGAMESTENGFRLYYDESEVTDEMVTMTRSGKAISSLFIEKGKKHHCHYGTEFGDFMIGVCTDEIRNELAETGGEIYLKYTLDINSSYMSENEMFINVKECN